MSQQIETAAERYRRLKADRQVETFDFTSPSGMTWKLRKPDLQQFIASGLLPLELTAKMVKAQKQGVAIESVVEQLNLDEQVKLIQFNSALVKYCAVDPRIVETPTSGDEIAYIEVERDDYEAILAWANSGGGEATGLETFRQ